MGQRINGALAAGAMAFGGGAATAEMMPGALPEAEAKHKVTRYSGDSPDKSGVEASFRDCAEASFDSVETEFNGAQHLRFRDGYKIPRSAKLTVREYRTEAEELYIGGDKEPEGSSVRQDCDGERSFKSYLSLAAGGIFKRVRGTTRRHEGDEESVVNARRIRGVDYRRFCRTRAGRENGVRVREVRKQKYAEGDRTERDGSVETLARIACRDIGK